MFGNISNLGPAPNQIKEILTRSVFYRPADTYSIEAALKLKEDIKAGKATTKNLNEL